MVCHKMNGLSQSAELHTDESCFDKLPRADSRTGGVGLMGETVPFHDSPAIVRIFPRRRVV